jgi:putative ABC transport system permease protein
VKDIRDLRLEDQPMQAIYTPLEEEGATRMTVVLRTDGDPHALVPALRAAVRNAAGPVVIANVRTLDELLLRSASERRLNAWLFGAFGVLGLLLAATGIYGVLATDVSARAREIGVRSALGATRSALLRMIVRQGMTLTAAGVAAGLIGAALASRWIASLLFGVSPLDTVTYAAGIATMLAVAGVACWLPARRASRVDPAVVLRD